MKVYNILNRLKSESNKGFTLIEILLAVGLLSFGLCAILAAYISTFVLTSTSKNVNIATDAALGLMEQIRTFKNPCSNATIPFTQIDNLYDCSSGTPGYRGLNFTVNAIPSSRGIVYVNNTNPELLTVTISVCWRQGNRTIGEDRNLNGVLNSGEDTNGNNMIDSTVELVTKIASR